MEIPKGERIKGYEFRKKIGSGGFGAVYKAYQSSVGREVAIKVILPGFANKPKFVQNFEKEAQIVARLEHLHIAPLYDYWRDSDGAYLVMRMLKGGSLQDALNDGPLSLENTSIILDHISSALAVAHQQNIIHRDIKPANILLDEDGNAYLSDFGVAKDLEIESSGNLLADEVIGSLDYLSPEQARNEPITPRTDIYSLGIVLYEMLVGEYPFPNSSSVEKLYKHINSPLPEISNLDQNISSNINKVIQKATAKNPSKRFGNPTVFAEAFREAANLNAVEVEGNIVELLTPREQEVLRCITEGKSNREIASDLFVEIATVKWYIKQIYRKLQVRNRVQAIVRSRELNLIVDDWKDVEELDAVSIPSLSAPKNPYKGLRAFQIADEKDFFGRERLTKKILNRLGEEGEFSRFLAIVGPSGSGKSSLVKAGLIPALWREESPKLKNLYIAEMLPGTHPLDELEVALTRIAASNVGNLAEQLNRDERGLSRIAQLILPNDDSQLLLVIDQFEEIFNQVEDEESRKHFLNLLMTAITDKRSRVRIIITLRADFYDRPLQYPDFGKIIRNRMETVLPLSVGELEQAIAQPATQIGMVFEDGLIAKIIEDVHYQPGALPLLQYALRELFENRNNLTLTMQEYQKIGGVVGALAMRAEDLFKELDEVGQQIARQVFLRLVTIDKGVEDTRRRVSLSEVTEVSDNRDLAEEIIDAFANYRLITLGNHPNTHEPTVEIAHEAILHQWSRLRNWINDGREDIANQHQLTNLAREWQHAEYKNSFLVRGSRLKQFEEWSETSALLLTSKEKDFLAKSIDVREEETKEVSDQKTRELKLEKRANIIIRVLVAVFFLGSIVSTWFAIKSNQAEQQALIQAGIGLSGQARLELINGSAERAVLLALEALENYPYTWQAERALFEAVQQNRILNVLTEHSGWIGSADWSPDGTKLVTASEDNTARIWDTSTWEELQILAGHEGEVFTAFWSPDGTMISTASTDGTAKIWDADTGKVINTLVHSDLIIEANWSPDGTKIVTGSYDGTAIVWNATDGEQLTVFDGHRKFVEVARWSPSGSRIATASGDRTARIWNAETGKEILMLSGHTDALLDVSWSPNGKYLATGSYDGTAKIWDAYTGNELSTLNGEGLGEIRWVLWSPDGSRLLIVERGGNLVDGAAAIWNVSTGEQVFLLPGLGDLWFAEWSADGSRVVVNDETSKTRVWDATTGKELFVLSRPQTLGIVSWSPDGTEIVTGYEDGTIMVWDATNLEIFAIPGHIPNAIAWSPDGNYFVRIERQGETKIIDSVSGKSILTFPDVGTSYNGVSWSPDGQYIATGHTNGTARIWDAITGVEIHTIKIYNDQVWDPSWSRDSKQISTTGMDGKAHIFDVDTGKWVKSLGNPGHGVMLNAVWSPDNSLIAAGNMEGLVLIWDAQTWEEVQRIEIGEWLMGVDWSPDGKQLAVSVFLNGLSQVYDVETGNLITSFSGHNAPVIFSQWSPDGTRIVTAGEDAIRVWNAVNGAEYATFNHGGWRVFWSPDGSKLLTSGTDGMVRMWQVFPDTQSLVTFAKECCLWRELTIEERELFGLAVQP